MQAWMTDFEIAGEWYASMRSSLHYDLTGIRERFFLGKRIDFGSSCFDMLMIRNRR